MSSYPVPLPPEGSNAPVYQPDQGFPSAPSLLTPAGWQNAAAQVRHTLALHQARRDVELARVGVAKKLDRQLCELEAESILHREEKFAIQRAVHESRIIAGDDAEIRAMLGAHDDGRLAAMRLRNLRGL